MKPKVAAKNLSKFDPKTFLSKMDGGRKITAFPKKHIIFAQGDSSDAVFYIQKGKVKLTVVSQIGKEATDITTGQPRTEPHRDRRLIAADKTARDGIHHFAAFDLSGEKRLLVQFFGW
jgi:hypothetical protein